MNGETPPTRVRHRVIAVCALMSGLLYLDRFCVSFAETYIKQDLGLSEFAISLMFSAFFLTYALGQPTSGWLADRFGGRTMLTLYILAWSLFTGLIGLANGLVMLVLLRLGLGFAQAGAYPTAANLIAKWAPLSRRGMASSMVALGGRVGGVLSLFITGYIILLFVPVEVDSKLTTRDILQSDRLCYELLHGNQKTGGPPGDGGLPARIGSRLLQGFPSALRQQVETESQRFAIQQQESASRQAMPAGTEATSEALRRELVGALNASLGQRNLFSAAELVDVKLEHEARNLLKQDPSSLSQPEVERLNRLILEAVYPAAVKRVYCAGWRGMMVLYGALGIPLTLLFWMICRDEPRKHPRCNSAELEIIERGRKDAGSISSRVGALPLMDLIANRSMWFNGAMQFFTNVGWVFFMTYAPRYFIEVHSAPVTQRTWMTSIPAVAACGGMFLGGIITDRALHWFGRRWGRSLLIAVTRFLAGLTYLFCLLDPSPWTAVVILSVTSMMCDVGIPAVWAFQQDVGGKYSGSVLGWGNMWGNLGAVVGPQIIGAIVGTSQNWNAVFIACAIAFFLSGLAALGIDATKPIEREKTA